MKILKMLVLIGLCVTFLSAATKHVLGQWVANVPIGYEKTGYKIYLYDINDPKINVLNEISEGNEFVWRGAWLLALGRQYWHRHTECI